MKVILLEDIQDLGKKYEVKEVKNGHARNFLIPKGLVKTATKKDLKWRSLCRSCRAQTGGIKFFNFVVYDSQYPTEHKESYYCLTSF